MKRVLYLVCIEENQIELKRALEKLKNSEGQYHNIDVDRIKKLVIEMINNKEIFSFVI